LRDCSVQRASTRESESGEVTRSPKKPDLSFVRAIDLRVVAVDLNFFGRSRASGPSSIRSLY
jgi:hypothetical protein